MIKRNTLLKNIMQLLQMAIIYKNGGDEPPVFHEEKYPMCKITKKTALEVIQCLKANMDNKYIIEKYNISKDIIRHINNGTSWKQEGENYPLRIDDDIPDFVLKILDMLEHTNLTQKEIATKLGVARSTVTMINIGKNHRLNNKSYPIRKI